MILNNCTANINLYESIIDAGVTLDHDDLTNTDWENFDNKKYKKIVLKYAIEEIKEAIKDIPKEFGVEYVEGSAYIDSPTYYNYRGDILCFKLKCNDSVDGYEIGKHIEEVFVNQWNEEFGAIYSIYERISGNHSIDEFYYDEEAV